MMTKGVLLAATLLMAMSAPAQIQPSQPAIHMIYMGGNDCPPCIKWRAEELPKLQKTEVFGHIKFTYVQKSIMSAVPPRMFMPSDVAQYKDQLDIGSGGRSGSPQTAIFVDGRLYDYYFGARSADKVEGMIHAILSGTKYPFERCVKRDSKSCLDHGG